MKIVVHERTVAGAGEGLPDMDIVAGLGAIH
jgi:hypothetical protein